jgi:hypothetical protein
MAGVIQDFSWYRILNPKFLSSNLFVNCTHNISILHASWTKAVADGWMHITNCYQNDRFISAFHESSQNWTPCVFLWGCTLIKLFSFRTACFPITGTGSSMKNNSSWHKCIRRQPCSQCLVQPQAFAKIALIRKSEAARLSDYTFYDYQMKWIHWFH